MTRHVSHVYLISDTDEILFFTPLRSVLQLYIYRAVLSTVFGGVTVLWRDDRYKWYVVAIGALTCAGDTNKNVRTHVFIISKLRHNAPISQRLRASATCVTHS